MIWSRDEEADDGADSDREDRPEDAASRSSPRWSTSDITVSSPGGGGERAASGSGAAGDRWRRARAGRRLAAMGWSRTLG